MFRVVLKGLLLGGSGDWFRVLGDLRVRGLGFGGSWDGVPLRVPLRIWGLGCLGF